MDLVRSKGARTVVGTTCEAAPALMPALSVRVLAFALLGLVSPKWPVASRPVAVQRAASGQAIKVVPVGCRW